MKFALRSSEKEISIFDPVQHETMISKPETMLLNEI